MTISSYPLNDLKQLKTTALPFLSEKCSFAKATDGGQIDPPQAILGLRVLNMYAEKQVFSNIIAYIN